jgi:hypothetical protein
MFPAVVKMASPVASLPTLSSASEDECLHLHVGDVCEDKADCPVSDLAFCHL